jgi:hypothetical protein
LGLNVRESVGIVGVGVGIRAGVRYWALNDIVSHGGGVSKLRGRSGVSYGIDIGNDRSGMHYRN